MWGRIGLGLLALSVLLVACGGDEESATTPGVCAPTATISLASEANGLVAQQMPLVSAVFFEYEDTYLNLVIGDFVQSETELFIDRPPGYLQLLFLLDHGGKLKTGAQDVITDIFRDGGASAPTIRPERGTGVRLTVIEADRICGEIDIDDGETTISGAFEAKRIPGPPRR
jgi:hypothetical protein